MFIPLSEDKSLSILLSFVFVHNWVFQLFSELGNFSLYFLSGMIRKPHLNSHLHLKTLFGQSLNLATNEAIFEMLVCFFFFLLNDVTA